MRHAKRWLGLIIVLGALGSANACSNQGEGQRCDKNSGDADCESGLVCTTIKTQTPVTPTTSSEAGQAAPAQAAALTPSVCCPKAGQIASTAACQAIASAPPAAIDAGSGSGGMDAGSGGSAGTGGSTGGRDAATGGSAGGKDAAAGGSAESGSPADASLDSSRD